MSNKNNNSFLWGVHYFRGVAILIIIVVHIWMNPSTHGSLDKTDWVGVWRESLFDGSTIYFILISGFLFQYLSGRFKIMKYYGNKFKYILIPYAILTAIFLALQAFVGVEKETIGWYINQLPQRLLKGNMSIQLWYIPFISIIFLFSPLLLRIPEKVRVKFFPWLLLLPLLGTRTGVDITIGQYIYFAPIYMFGMYLCLRFENVMRIVKKYQFLIVAVVVVMTCVMFYLCLQRFDIETSRPYLAFVYVRNMLVSLLLLYVMELGRAHYKKWLDMIAVYSFALYFTHVFLHQRVGRRLLSIANREIDSEVLMFVVSTLYVPLFICANLLLCVAIKRVSGKYSRYLIGV